MPSDCPPPSEFEALAEGSAVPDKLRQHAAQCAHCRSLLADIRENQRFLRNAGTALRQAAGDPRAGSRRADAVSPPPADLVPGFTLFEEISRGGQGVVYRAVQLATKRPAAVKMLLNGEWASPRQRSRFEREIEIAAALRHPNIITIFESGRTTLGHQYVAMEYVESVALDKHVAQSLPPAQHRTKSQVDSIARIMASIASAVGAAHTRGVIHRDLKPSNVMIDAAGIPRVLDFGLARPAAAKSDNTQTQEFVGTPAFAAPEQFTSSALADARTDVYSLGVMLYALLSGELPYPKSTTFADVARHALATEPPYLSKGAPRISKDLETIVHKCLAKQPERRYASAVAFEADLLHYLRNEAIDARRDSAWYMLKKAVAQNRRLLAAVVAILVVLAVNGYMLFRQMNAASIARGNAEMEQHRAEMEATRAQAIAQIMRAVIPVGNLFSDRDKDRRGRAAFDGLTTLESELEWGAYSAQPELETVLRSTLAGVYASSPQLLGHGEIAIRHALTGRIRVYGPHHVETAVGYHELAEVLLSRSRFEEAEEASRAALDIRLKRLGERSAAVGRSYEQLSRICTKRADLATAVTAGNRAAEIFSQPGMPPRDRAAALNSLAEALWAGSRVDQADLQAESALRLAVELPDDDAVLAACLELSERLRERLGWGKSGGTPLRPEILQGLAHRLTLRDPAISHAATLARLLEVRRSLLPPTHPAIRRSLTGLASRYFQEALQSLEAGIFYQARNQIEASRAALIESLPLMEVEFGANHIAIANSCETIAHYSQWCRRFDEAVHYVERSRAIWETQPPELRDSFTIALAARWHGWFLCLAQDWPAAERVSREAILRLSRLLSSEHHAIAIAQAQLAWCISEQGDSREALELVKSAYDSAIRSPATPPDQLGWMQSIYGKILIQNGNFSDGAAMVDLGAQEFWQPRAVYPIEAFLRPAREALRQSDDARALADFECRWSEVLSLWEPQ